MTAEKGGLRLKARWRLVRATVRTLLWITVGLLLLVAFFVKTGLGHRAVLGWGVGQLRARVAGSVEVDAIRSANLLRGARLVGVRLETPDGEPFIEADSIEVRYSVAGLLRGGLAFEDVRLWRPRVVWVRDAGGSSFSRWFRGDGVPAPDSAAAAGATGPAVSLDAVEIVDGSFALRLPLDGEPGELLRTEVGPEGGVVRALDVRGIDAHVPRVVVGPETGIEAVVERGVGELDYLARRVPITELRGGVTVRDGVTDVQLRRLAVPGVEGSGAVRVEPSADGGTVTTVSARLPTADLAEWAWISDAIPPISGSLTLAGTLEPGVQRWTVEDVEGRWAGGEIRGRATATLDPRPRFEDVVVDVSRLPVSELERWLQGPLEAEATLSGRVALSGRPDALRLDGDARVRTPDAPVVEATFEGGVGMRPDGPTFDAFQLVVDPLDYGVLGRFVPAVTLRGPGRMQLRVTGSFQRGLAVNADVHHAPPGVAPSRVLLQGNVLADTEDRVRVDVQGDLSPLSLDALALDYPDLPVSGSLTGPVRARGLLRDLDVQADLMTPEGRVDVSGRVNLRDPPSGYRLDATVTDFLASALTPALPDPTRIDGRIEVEGRGFTAADMNASARVRIDEADVRGVRVDSLFGEVRIAEGVVQVDSLLAEVAGFSVAGRGTLAADTARPGGRFDLRFDAPDLTGIRAVFRGDTVLTADDLTALDRDVLVLRGVDPDTLPMAAEVTAEGEVAGEVVLEGSIGDFSAVGWVEGSGLRYGDTEVQVARADFSATGLPAADASVHADVTLDSTTVASRTFTRGSLAVDFTRSEGRAWIDLARDSTEDYRLAGRFDLDSVGGTLDVEEAVVRIDSLRYRSTHPTRLTWTDSLFTVDSLEVVGGGADPVRIRASGTLPRRGAADFGVDVTGLDLRRLARVAQREDLELAGILDFEGSIRGSAARPRVEGRVAARGFEAGSLALDRLEGDVSYADLRLALNLDVWERETRALQVDGTWPTAFTLDGSRPDVSSDPVDLTIRADSLPADLILTLLEDLEDTRGSLSGELRVGGTPSELEPSGEVRLSGGAWTVGALGVRQERVEATFDVHADRRVLVEATGRSGGTVDVRGTVRLDSLLNPGLDLDITLESFQAVNRRDIAGAVSGQLDLLGSYGAPRVQGTLQVERGDLYLDEFARNVGVIDLSDPRFFAFIDENLLQSRPLLAETRNPFMDNLLVAIDLGVQRNTWLRSQQLNVEMRGDLIVTYDRRSRDVVMVGELEAVRGQYQFLGQTFDVRGGSVEFVGIPGINPNLAIDAEARVRRRQAEPLTITAQVGGTLIEPRVELTTPDAAVSQSDMLSYIAVGRPASALTAGGQETVGAVAGGVASFGFGTLTSSLSSLAQGSGWLDFLSITQAVDATALGGSQAIGQSFAGTQVELGRYFGGGDYFVALMFRPLYAAGGTGSLLGGARLEWQASESYNVELFAEDRFLRTGSFGFREFGIESSLIYGFSFFREWGY